MLLCYSFKNYSLWSFLHLLNNGYKQTINELSNLFLIERFIFNRYSIISSIFFCFDCFRRCLQRASLEILGLLHLSISIINDQKLKKSNQRNDNIIQLITCLFTKEITVFYIIFKELSNKLSFFHIFMNTNICKSYNLKNQIDMF